MDSSLAQDAPYVALPFELALSLRSGGLHFRQTTATMGIASVLGEIHSKCLGIERWAVFGEEAVPCPMNKCLLLRCHGVLGFKCENVLYLKGAFAKNY